MKVPNFINSQIVDKNGHLTESWQQIFIQLFSELQNNVSNEGLIAPNQPTSNLSLLGGTQKNGSILYDKDRDEGVICKNGEYKRIVTEPLTSWIDSHDLVVSNDSGGITIEFPNGASNQLLGMNNSGDDQEYKSLIGTTEQIDITNSPNSIQVSSPLTYKRLCYLETSGLLEKFSFTVTSGTTFDIAANSIQYIDSYTDINNPIRVIIDTPQIIGVVPIGLGYSIRTYLYWDVTNINSPVLEQTTEFLLRTECRKKIFFGTVIHSNFTTISEVEPQGINVTQSGFLASDILFLLVNNGLREIEAGKFYPYAAGTMMCKFSSSNISLKDVELLTSEFGNYPEAASIYRLSYQNPVPYFFRIYFDAYGFPQYTFSPDIDPNYYRDSTGSLVAIPSGYWSVQRFFYFSSGQKIALYGVAIYESERLALQGYLNEDISYILNNPATFGAIFAGYLIIKQGTTDLTDTSRAIFSDKNNPMKITPIDIVNRGVVSNFSVSNPSGLTLNWSSGVIYDIVTKLTVNINSGSGTLTNNAINYLYWNSGVILTLSTIRPSGNQITVASISVQAGNVYSIDIREPLTQREANLIRGVAIAFPTKVVYGLEIYPDTTPTYAFDIICNSGQYLIELTSEVNPTQIYTNNIPIVRHYHNAGVWASDTAVGIDNDYYDNGTNRVLMNNNYYAKSLFLHGGSLIHWVYPRAQYVNLINAQSSLLPEIPPGLVKLPKIWAYIQKQGDATLAPVGDPRWIDLRGIVV